MKPFDSTCTICSASSPHLTDAVYINNKLHCKRCASDLQAPQKLNSDLRVLNSEQNQKESTMQISVTKEDYLRLSEALDDHSQSLMEEKGEEYSIGSDFLAMENRLAGMIGNEPEYVSLIMVGKHITSLGIILDKQDVKSIKLERWDERIRDAINLLKITSAFIHAKQNDFSLHLGKKKMDFDPIPDA